MSARRGSLAALLLVGAAAPADVLGERQRTTDGSLAVELPAGWRAYRPRYFDTLLEAGDGRSLHASSPLPRPGPPGMLGR